MLPPSRPHRRYKLQSQGKSIFLALMPRASQGLDENALEGDVQAAASQPLCAVSADFMRATLDPKMQYVAELLEDAGAEGETGWGAGAAQHTWAAHAATAPTKGAA